LLAHRFDFNCDDAWRDFEIVAQKLLPARAAIDVPVSLAIVGQPPSGVS
jgi:hypothetical protein